MESLDLFPLSPPCIDSSRSTTQAESVLLMATHSSPFTYCWHFLTSPTIEFFSAIRDFWLIKHPPSLHTLISQRNGDQKPWTSFLMCTHIYPVSDKRHTFYQHAKGYQFQTKCMTLLLYQEFFRLEFPSGAIGDTIADSICGVSTVSEHLGGRRGSLRSKSIWKNEDIMLKLKISTLE